MNFITCCFGLLHSYARSILAGGERGMFKTVPIKRSCVVARLCNQRDVMSGPTLHLSRVEPQELPKGTRLLLLRSVDVGGAPVMSMLSEGKSCVLRAGLETWFGPHWALAGVLRSTLGYWFKSVSQTRLRHALEHRKLI